MSAARAFLRGLLPYLKKEVGEEVGAILDLMDRFPELSAKELLAQVDATLRVARTTPAALRRRAQAILEGSPSESITDLLSDLRNVSASELTKFAQGFGLDLGGNKREKLVAIQRWLESRGAERPPSKGDQARAAAERAAGDLPLLVAELDRCNADDIMSRIEKASRDLKKDEFIEFARLLGLSSAKGSKAAVKKQLKEHINGRFRTLTQLSI